MFYFQRKKTNGVPHQLDRYGLLSYKKSLICLQEALHQDKITYGMNDLMRPALYEAKHVIVPLTSRPELQTYHVVGPVCESTDIFARDLMLSELRRGDLVAILTSGAYGRVLANQYNRRPMIKEYMI